jgi:hypothetical protein
MWVIPFWVQITGPTGPVHINLHFVENVEYEVDAKGDIEMATVSFINNAPMDVPLAEDARRLFNILKAEKK